MVPDDARPKHTDFPRHTEPAFLFRRIPVKERQLGRPAAARILAFLFRCIPVNERQFGGVRRSGLE
jgi:hypothetical protein